MSNSSGGRLVWNHSTHLPGLIPLLEKLTTCQGIRTITPGEICSVRGHCPQLKLRISVPIRGGYKVIARQGKTVQEVFIITDLTQDELNRAIAQLLK
ncbi:DUF2103 domain-containing protein [Pleurocapsales cyanobacterium LEGE 06147]|nr:DUF2103 domain-containing protein [Pleurocapsales cyanobacterium LEGE 06147]